MEKIFSILEKSNNVTRSTYVWNAISAMMLAMQSPIILMVMTRTNGVKDAGIFSIAIAVANLMMYVGQYGIRRFQSSDVKEQFTFREYHGMRVITCVVMVVACAGYCVFGSVVRHYSATKFTVIFMICMLKLIQAYSDVFHGNMQQKGRLDVAAKATSFRYTAEIVIYCSLLIATHNIVIASIITVACSVVLMVITSFNANSHYCDTMKPEVSRTSFKAMMIEGFPLFVSMFLNIYVGNAPKYAIDAYLTDDIQAVFNLIFMPAFVVQIATQFLFNPLITVYAELWISHSEKKFKRLMRSIRKMSIMVLGLTLLGLAVAATIGIPVLSFIFGVDLSAYKAELCIIMIGGGLLAYATFFSTIIAIIRIQRSLIYCYGIVAIAALALSGVFVRTNGITGASWLYVLLMAVLAAALFVAMYWRLNKEKKELQTA